MADAAEPIRVQNGRVTPLIELQLRVSARDGAAKCKNPKMMNANVAAARGRSWRMATSVEERD